MVASGLDIWKSGATISGVEMKRVLGLVVLLGLASLGYCQEETTTTTWAGDTNSVYAVALAVDRQTEVVWLVAILIAFGIGLAVWRIAVLRASLVFVLAGAAVSWSGVSNVTNLPSVVISGLSGGAAWANGSYALQGEYGSQSAVWNRNNESGGYVVRWQTNHELVGWCVTKAATPGVWTVTASTWDLLGRYVFDQNGQNGLWPGYYRESGGAWLNLPFGGWTLHVGNINLLCQGNQGPLVPPTGTATWLYDADPGNSPSVTAEYSAGGENSVLLLNPADPSVPGVLLVEGQTVPYQSTDLWVDGQHSVSSAQWTMCYPASFPTYGSEGVFVYESGGVYHFIVTVPRPQDFTLEQTTNGWKPFYDPSYFDVNPTNSEPFTPFPPPPQYPEPEVDAEGNPVMMMPDGTQVPWFDGFVLDDIRNILAQTLAYQQSIGDKFGNGNTSVIVTGGMYSIYVTNDIAGVFRVGTNTFLAGTWTNGDWYVVDSNSLPEDELFGAADDVMSIWLDRFLGGWDLFYFPDLGKDPHWGVSLNLPNVMRGTNAMLDLHWDLSEEPMATDIALVRAMETLALSIFGFWACLSIVRKGIA